MSNPSPLWSEAQLIADVDDGPEGPRVGAFLGECGGVGRQMLLQGRLHGPESLSRELFSSALKLAANQDLMGPGGEELARARRAFAARLRDLVARLIVIDEIDATSRQEAVGVEP